jgi:hypothetical protein
VALQEPGDGLVVQTRSQDAFQGGVELGEQAAYPVADAGGLGGEVLVEPVSTVSSAVISSVSSRERRVCGMVRAASAMTAASLATLL